MPLIDVMSDSLTEVGYGALTIEGIAARAGVGKTTVYRWWPTEGALVIEAIQVALPTPTQANTGDLRRDLLAAVRRVVNTFARTAAPQSSRSCAEQSPVVTSRRTWTPICYWTCTPAPCSTGYSSAANPSPTFSPSSSSGFCWTGKHPSNVDHRERPTA
jgi:AcrR family transcriptional regulator